MLQVNGETLEFFVSGDRESRTVRLLIQGLGCEARYVWSDLVQSLKLQGDQALNVAFNVRGIGGSSGWPSSLVQMADDALELLETLDAGPVHVVGHSLGGAVGLHLYSRAPSFVRSLTLMDSVPKYSDTSRRGFEWRAELVKQTGRVSSIFESVVPRSFGSYTIHNQPDVISGFCAMLSRQSADVYSQICALAASTDLRECLLSVRVPTRFIGGVEDHSTPPALLEDLAETIGCTFYRVANAGHNPPVEQPEALARILLSDFS
uniref:alpha/beta fold hydrolase n=1 Tax=Gordonia sp. B7-2 TaxID=3420932 RepID=UPI003D8B8A2C